MTLLDFFANPVAAFLADLIVKASVLLLLAMVLAATLRKSSAAIRHRVWSLTFAGLLLLPVLSYVMPELQLPILPAELIQPLEVSVEEVPQIEESISDVTTPQPEPFLAAQPSASPPPFDARMRGELPPWERDPGMSPPLEKPSAVEVAEEVETLPEETPTEAQEPAESVAAVVPPQPNTSVVWLWIWTGGLSVFLLPVFIGLLQNRILSRLSQNVSETSTLELLAALRERLSIQRNVRLVESDHSRIPLTWGLFFPVILFPSNWNEWSTGRKRLVLLHELAHVKRRDVAFQLLARMVCAIYWFHPLSWLALRRLKNESELACDDCVLLTGESPQKYASELVDIARSARRAIYPAAVAMAQTSSLEQRIRALLDRARSRMPLGGRLAAVLLAVSLMTVGGIAAVKPVASEVAAETETPVEEENVEVAVVNEASDKAPKDDKTSRTTAENDKKDNQKAKETSDKLQYFRGTVVDPDGNPVAGARVRYLYSFAEYPEGKAWLFRESLVHSNKPTNAGVHSQATTDENGEYALTLDWEGLVRTLRERGSETVMYGMRIVASRPDSDPPIATGWRPGNIGRMARSDTTIRLPSTAAGPIRGQLIDLEGRPLGEARVTVEIAASAEPGEVDRWLSDVKRLTDEGKLPVDSDKDRRFSRLESPETTAARFPSRDGSLTGKMIGLRPVVSDEQGRFEIPNPGDDRLLVLRIESMGHATVIANVLTRDMDRIEARRPSFGAGSPFLTPPHEYHGVNCAIVVPPSHPVVGVVRDADTNDPIPGIVVAANQGEAVSETDREGRYRLDGLEPGTIDRMSLHTPASSPFFPRDLYEAPKATGTTPIELNFELRAGIWIEGRVVNRKTGEGQPNVSLHYTPYLDNPHAERYPAFDPQAQSIITNSRRFMTDEEGRFRLRAIPGRGIVMAVCRDGVFRQGLGADRIEGLEEKREFNRRLTYDLVSERFVNSMAAVDISANAQSTTLNLEIDPGGTVTLNVLDPNGKPLEGYKVSGHKSSITSPNHMMNTPQVEIQGLGPKEQRPVLMLHEERQLGRVLEIDADAESGSEKTVTLQPLARMSGRLLDANGTPVEEAMVTIRVHNSYPGYSIHLGETFTGSNGRFEFNELLPGGDYRIFCSSESNRLELINSIVAKPGETIDFGDVDMTKEKASEPKRTPAKMSQSSTGSQSEATQIEARPQETVCAGQVVDGQGRPVNGAHVAVIARSQRSREGGDVFAGGEILSEGTSDSEGRFELTLEGVSGQTHHTPMVIARKEGAAMGWSDWGQIDLNAARNTVTLTLRPEVPIRGRLIDIDGRPVAGAKLLVWTLTKPTENPGFPTNVAIYTVAIEARVPLAWMPTMTTDDEGRFTVQGVPAGYGVQVNVDGGEQFAPQRIALNTGQPEQRGERDGLYLWLVRNVKPGEEAVLALAPAQKFEGVVRFADTGEPAADARMIIWASQQRDVGSTMWVRGQTDANGRYAISPNPGVAFGYIVYSPDASPYLGRQTPTYEPMIPNSGTTTHVDIDLPRGVRVRGQVIEAGTGTPVSGATVQYIPEFGNNKHASDEIVTGSGSARLTDADGRFDMAVLPGPGRILVHASELRYVLQEIGSQEISRNELGGDRSYAHAIQKIEPEVKSGPLELTLELQPGETISGRAVDEQGEPIVKATMVTRLAVPSMVWRASSLYQATDGRFELHGLKAGKEYPVHFLDAEKKLGATVILSTREKDPTVVLEPCGRARMRLVDSEGNPVADHHCPRIEIVVASGPSKYESSASQGGKLIADSDSLSNVDPKNYADLPRTDEDGELLLPVLIPGATYQLVLRRGESNEVFVKNFEVQAGETLDLGDIDVSEKTANQTSVEAAQSSADSLSTTQSHKSGRVCAGQVVDKDGKPLPGASVAVIAMQIGPQRGGDLTSKDVILAEATTGKDGRYRLPLEEVSSQTHRYPVLICRQEGMAIAWQSLNLDAPPTDATLKLTPEQLLSGRLIDIDGKPADGVKLQVTTVRNPQSKTPANRGAGYRGNELSAAWIPEVATDDQGQFTIHGLPEGFGVFLKVAADERFAPQDIALNTGIPEQRGERDGTYRPLVKNLEPGEEAVLALAPAQRFEGVIRYADTGEPAPFARLTIWASQQEFGGSMMSVAGQADAEGRYQITAKPGIRFGVNAYPPDGTPYLVRQTPFDQSIIWKAGDRVKQFDVELPRGVLVKGKVVERGTGKPVAGASIQYHPEQVNNKNTSDEIVTGWQGIQITDDNGQFEIAVLPGPGRLLVHGPDWKYVLREIGSRELSSNQPGGRRNYAHAIEKIDPVADAEPLEVTLELQPGETVSGRAIDEQGEPVDQAVMITPLAIYPTSIYWSGSELFKAKGGRFELSGLEVGNEYPVHFLDAERKLGATAVLNTRDKNPTVVLKPCGQARMRLIDSDGKPVADNYPTIEIVVTPGAYKYDRDSFKAGKLAANSDFIVNVDRTNYRDMPKSDKDGELLLPVLIPGATYQVTNYNNQIFQVSKTFTVKAGENLDLGDVLVERQQ